jgi:hypothetical protein
MQTASAQQLAAQLLHSTLSMSDTINNSLSQTQLNRLQSLALGNTTANSSQHHTVHHAYTLKLTETVKSQTMHTQSCESFEPWQHTTKSHATSLRFAFCKTSAHHLRTQ